MKMDFNNELEKLNEIKEYVEGSLMISFCNYTRNKIINMIQSVIDMITKKQDMLTNDMGNVSDGYHTFNELYHHRAVLFSVICNKYPNLAWKSLHHHDPNQPMYDGMFIVGINTPNGQATYHYDIDPYWDIFDVEELDKAPEWDGHTPAEAIERIASLNTIKDYSVSIDDLIGDFLDV